MGKLKLDVKAEPVEMADVARQIEDDINLIQNQVNILENQIIPAIKKSWESSAGKAFADELMFNIASLKDYSSSVKEMKENLLTASKSYHNADNAASQRVRSIGE